MTDCNHFDHDSEYDPDAETLTCLNCGHVDPAVTLEELHAALMFGE